MKNFTKTFAAFLLALLTTAFTGQEAMAQVSAEETWELTRVGSSGLPATVDNDDDGCTEEVVSGTLTLATDGTWRLVTNEREVCGNDTDNDRDSETGRYTMSGDQITFLDDDGNAEDIDNDDRSTSPDIEDLVSGTRNGDTMTVQIDDGRTELTFTRR